jgi:hypothetical protein
MSQSLLDSQPDCRRRIANLVVVGGATRQQIADDLARHYTLPKTPSPRTVTGWLADEEVRALIAELEGIRADLSPGESPGTLLPEPVDPMEASMDLYGLADDCPAFRDLLHRADHDPACPENVIMDALADDDDLEAAARKRLDGWDPGGYELAAHYARRYRHADYDLPEAAKPYADLVAAA